MSKKVYGIFITYMNVTKRVHSVLIVVSKVVLTVEIFEHYKMQEQRY